MNNVPSTSDDRVTLWREHFEDGEDSETRLDHPRPKQYRDIPIYTEPGSPILSRAYLTDEEVHASSTASDSDEYFDVNDCSGADAVSEWSSRTPEIEVCFFSLSHIFHLLIQLRL